MHAAASHGRFIAMRISGMTVAALMLLGACSDSHDNDTASAADCLTVSNAMASAVAEGAESGTGMQAVRAAAVKSPDFENVYFIAVEFTATGISSQQGVWASNSLNPGGGIIMAADSTAQQFTDWPDADSTDSQIAITDPSIRAALACL
jgi:hypothetical protein